MKIYVLIAFALILGSLTSALHLMLRKRSSAHDQSKNRALAKALALRVGFSLLLFASILLAALMGWIQPTGLPLR